MKAYRIRISLEHVAPPVWRQAVVPAGITFSRLAAILNDVMGWMGGHLFSITTAKGHYVSGIPECEGMGPLPDGFGEELSGGDDAIDPIFTSNKNLSYIYDLGDNWEHYIQVEAVLDDYPHSYPQVLDGTGACPPDDIGGPSVYMDMIEHPEEFGEDYEMFLWEREDFDLEETNQVLKEVYGAYCADRGQSFDKLSPFLGEERGNFPKMEDALQYYRVEDLKCICRKLGIQGYSGLRKQQLVEFVLSQVADQAIISNAFMDMEDGQIEFFESLFSDPCSVLDLSEEGRLQAEDFLSRGLVFQTLDGVFFVPEEVQKSYASIDKKALSKTRRRVGLVLDYCKAAVNLYGIVEMEHLLRLFNQQNEETLQYRELLQVLKLADRQESCPIKWEDEYLFDTEIDWEIFDILLEQQEGKPYYVPSKQEFLKYSDFYYCEKPLAWEAMEHFFQSDIGMTPFNADLLCHELEMLVHVGAHMDMLMELLDAFEMPDLNDHQLIKLTELLMDAWNCTRMVINRGFTPNEMRGMDETEHEKEAIPNNVIPFPAPERKK